MLLLPLCQIGKQQPDVLFVADEIVIDDEECAAPIQIVQSIEFREHLLIAFCSWHASVNLDDVTELARERTAARILNRHRAVTF